jgi:hypothetical protein
MKIGMDWKIIAAIGFLVGASGCTSSGIAPERLDGNATEATFQIQAAKSATGSTTGALRAESGEGSEGSSNASGTVTLTAARIYVKEVKLEVPGLPDETTCEEVQTSDEFSDDNEDSEVECSSDGSSELSLKGPFAFDLMTGLSTPDVSAFTIPSGTYEEIKISLEESAAEDGVLAEGDPLLGRTLVAEGTYTDANGSVDFSLSLKFSEEIQIENSDGITVAEQSATTIIATLDPVAWFSGVDFNCAGSSTAVIDDESGDDACNDIEDIVKENIKNSFGVESENEDSSGAEG